MITEDKAFSHVPVLFSECLDNLCIKENGIYVDGTLGGAGHSSGILKRLGKGGLLIGIDQDDDALAVATARLQKIKNEDNDADFCTFHANFVEMPEVCRHFKVEKVDGILLDIGVSSYQLDTEERGFSYRFDSPLDMRMDRSRDFSAYEVVNEYSERELSDVIFNYGEEKFARKIAAIIVERRKVKPIETTFELVDIIKAAIPASKRFAKGEGHPAKRTFQALRIEVNKELDVLENVIDKAIDLLNPGGRLCIITFHSLEDRIVKQKFKKAAQPCECPPSFPVCVCGKKSKGKVITSKPIEATEKECEENSRSSCAKLRVFEKR